MGIQGLLPLLKSIHRPTELKKFEGQTLGVDAYGWLHRGAISCAIELAQGKPTRKYVDFAMHRVRMLQHFGVTPYLVFDGGYLPSKAETEASRATRRQDTRKAGLELLKAGKPSQAHMELQKAIDITPEMARQLIEELKKLGLPYVVAPYEADPQMVYLERQGLISGIISEDSDLLVFGARRLLTKLDQYGNCIEINRRDFCAVREVSLTGWTDAQFRQMAILSGCDYLAGINSLGLKTAHRLIRKHKSPERVLRMLQFEGKYRLPTDYPKLYRQAELTFLHPWVFCPTAKQLVNLTPVPSDIKLEDMPFIGPGLESSVAQGIANGNLNPFTRERIGQSPLPEPRKRAASSVASRAPQSTAPRPTASKPIDSFFKGDGRIPLGEMEPNCFTVDPNRVSATSEEDATPVVFPLPRPYINEPAPPTTRSLRTYINTNISSSRSQRRRTEPIANLLSNNGRSLNSTSRRKTMGPPERVTRDATASNSGISAPPSKKARLCDDVAEPGSLREKSRFFPKQDSKPRPRKSDEYQVSDSVEAALRDMPDLDGWDTKPRGKKQIQVFEESAQEEAKVMAEDSSTTSHKVEKRASSGPHSTPLRSILGQYSYSQNRRVSAGPRHGSSQNRLSISSTQDSIPSSTPDLSMSVSTQMSRTQTPATPRLSPLQQIGARALNRHSSPSAAGRHPPKKRISGGRPSLDSMPLNPSFVPLPAVTVDEVERLHQTMGSEDQILPDSEHEEAADELEPCKTPGERLDLSRFLFS